MTNIPTTYRKEQTDFAKAKTMGIRINDVAEAVKIQVDKRKIEERTMRILELLLRTPCKPLYKVFKSSLQTYVNAVDEPDRNADLNEKANELRITRTTETHEDLGLTPALLTL